VSQSYSGSTFTGQWLSTVTSCQFEAIESICALNYRALTTGSQLMTLTANSSSSTCFDHQSHTKILMKRGPSGYVWSMEPTRMWLGRTEVQPISNDCRCQRRPAIKRESTPSENVRKGGLHNM